MTCPTRGVDPAPDVFAAVMATGILSVAARDHGYRWIGDVLGVLATGGLLVLVAVVLAVTVVRRRICWDLADPDVTLRLFTFVAACAVLDSRLIAHPMVVRALGAVALSSWLALTVLTGRNMTAQPWPALRAGAHGGWLLASVGTSGLAVVAGQIAQHTDSRGWLLLAVPAWVLAVGSYLLLAWMMLCRVVAERTKHDGFEPDDWILMGAMAIATLAGDSIHGAAPSWLAGPVRASIVVTWVVASLWIPLLIYFMLHRANQRPGVLHFAGVWWAAVFPLGMYSVATYATAVQLGARSMRTVSLVFCWNALSAWLIVVVAGLLRVWAWFRSRTPAR